MRGPSEDPQQHYPLAPEIIPRLHVGVGRAAERDVTVSASLHSHLLGFGGKRVPREHPNYLARLTLHRLTVNWVDGPKHLFEWTGMPMWRQILAFIDRAHDGGHTVSIRCDRGESRSPTVAMVWWFRREHVRATVPEWRTPAVAAEAFKWRLYPSYKPGEGIAEWVADHWDELMAVEVSTPKARRHHVTEPGNDQGEARG